MKYLFKISALAIFAVLGAFVITGVNPHTATAQEAEENVETTEAEQPAESEENTESSRYSYIAQSGDSYTKIARKAVQTYGYYEDASLSLAQIVAAETFLTNKAESPNLNIGDTVSISEDAVKSAVEKAQSLDEAAEARWEKYVPFVDFNTDNVGESRE